MGNQVTTVKIVINAPITNSVVLGAGDIHVIDANKKSDTALLDKLKNNMSKIGNRLKRVLEPSECLSLFVNPTEAVVSRMSKGTTCKNVSAPRSIEVPDRSATESVVSRIPKGTTCKNVSSPKSIEVPKRSATDEVVSQNGNELLDSANQGMLTTPGLSIIKRNNACLSEQNDKFTYMKKDVPMYSSEIMILRVIPFKLGESNNHTDMTIQVVSYDTLGANGDSDIFGGLHSYHQHDLPTPMLPTRLNTNRPLDSNTPPAPPVPIQTEVSASSKSVCHTYE